MTPLPPYITHMITVTLDMAKRLKENGWFKRTIFVQNNRLGLEYYSDNEEISSYATNWAFYAPTAQELLDDLPTRIKIREDGRWGLLTIQKRDDIDYGVCYHNESLEGVYKGIHNGENLAEALGELRLRCKKNGYIE